MRLSFAVFAACALAAAPLLAAVDGVVTNGTTGQPAAGVTISLIQPGQQGMQTLGSTKTDAEGKFKFDAAGAEGGPQLLQGVFKGVTYTKFLTPGSPTTGVAFQVFDTSKSPAEARVSQHMLVLEPAERQMGVSETIIVENKGNTTYSNDELGGIRFYLPPEANGQAGVSVKGPGGMPLPRSGEKTNKPGVYKVAFPIKPGETEFTITYALPASDSTKYSGKVVGIDGQPAGPLRLIAPSGVTLESQDIRKLGQEPNTQATIYDVVATGAYAVKIQGMGSLRGPDTAAADAGGSESDSPPIESVPPKIYQRMPYLVALGFAVLAVGFLLLFRSSPVRDL